MEPPRLRPGAKVRVQTGALHFGRDAACLPLVHGPRHSSSRQVSGSRYRCESLAPDPEPDPYPSQTSSLCLWPRAFELPHAQTEEHWDSSLSRTSCDAEQPLWLQEAVALLAEWVAGTGAAVFTFGLGTRMMRGPFEVRAGCRL